MVIKRVEFTDEGIRVDGVALAAVDAAMAEKLNAYFDRQLMADKIVSRYQEERLRIPEEEFRRLYYGEFTPTPPPQERARMIERAEYLPFDVDAILPPLPDEED